MRDALSKRINAIQARQDRAAARTNVIQEYEFATRVTCPPSTSIHISGGKAWINSNYWVFVYYNAQKQADTIDFAATTNIGYSGSGPRPLDLSFTSPGYYKAIALALNTRWVLDEERFTPSHWEGVSWKYYILGGEDEHASAVEAEAEIDFMLNGGYGANGTYARTSATRMLFSRLYFGLVGIIFRNNGITDSAGAILPIDPLNRGQSYLYRDLRKNKNWICG